MNFLKRFIVGKSFLKPERQAGFSLVEMIIYTAVFAIIFTVIVQLFWRVQLSGSRLQIANEVKENVSQVMQLVTRSVRQAESLDEVASVFGSHPGALTLNDGDLITYDTYSHDVNIGGRLVPVRTLRFTQGLDPSVDITSNHVTVDQFIVTNLSQPGEPDVVKIDLQISNVNPDNDPDFDNSLSIQSSMTVRDEF